MATTTTDHIEQAIEKFEGLVQELEPQVAEYNRLREFLDTMKGKGSGKPRARASSNSRAPRGKRLIEFVQIVNDNPGITVSAAAAQMDSAPNYLYRLRDRAAADNLIRRDGANLFPVGVGASDEGDTD